jgi:hypothetical protein
MVSRVFEQCTAVFPYEYSKGFNIMQIKRFRIFLNRFDARKQGEAEMATCTFWTLPRILVKLLKLKT